jgi:ADP-ribosylglycohydrolase
MSRIRRGVIPEEMEDKWFVYWEEDTLFFHRSWTGFCVYVVRFSCDENGGLMVSADVNRDPDEYTNTDDLHDAALIDYLIDVLLLRRRASFPARLPTSGEAALEQWSFVGQAGLGIHPGDSAGGRARYVFIPKGARELSSSEIAARIRGCLLGGAVGDAYGAPLEFLSLGSIIKRWGPEGPTDLEPAFGRRGAITDDTQMTLFTAEGLIRGLNRRAVRGSGPDWTSVFQGAYWRWLRTQGLRPDSKRATAAYLTSLLTEVPELNHQRAPGNACLSALHSGKRGTPRRPINDRKGCGGVMRVAPVGLAGLSEPFEIGCRSAAVTHGHPSGWLAAGCLAQIIDSMFNGSELLDAAGLALDGVRQERRSDEVASSIEAALELAAVGSPSAERVESLGGGWVAEEALAIGLYCALVAESFEHGVRLAATHSGDSDSTGSITGQLLGARWGPDGIPERWLADLELRDVIEQVADDLYRAARVPDYLDVVTFDLERYPGW